MTTQTLEEEVGFFFNDDERSETQNQTADSPAITSELKDEKERNERLSLNPKECLLNLLKTTVVDDNQKVVRLFVPMQTKSVDVPLELFNERYISFMKSYLKQKNQNIVLSVSIPVDIRGINYLDIDHMENITSFDELQQQVADLLALFESMTNYYILTFYPEDIESRILKNDKVGCHIYIIHDNSSSNKEELKRIEVNLHEVLGEEFDIQPWKSATLNLPFSHKSNESSKYLINIDDCVPNNEDELLEKMSNIPFVSDSYSKQQLIDKLNSEVVYGHCEATDKEIDALIEGFYVFPTVHANRTKVNYEPVPNVRSILLGIKSFKDEATRQKLFDGIFAALTRHEGRLTKKAKECFTIEHMKSTNNKSNKYRKQTLYKLIERFNETYYYSTLIYYLDAFENGDYTFYDFKKELFESIYDVMNKLKQCVAVNLSGGFIVKFEDKYELMKLSDITREHDLIFTLKSTEQEIEEMKEKHKKVKDTYDISLKLLLTKQCYLCQLKQYKKVELWSSDKHVFSSFKGPIESQLNLDLVHRFINYFKSNVVHIEPFNELLDSISYTLKNNGELVRKFFVLYGKGHNGKTCLADKLADMFCDCGMVAAQTQFTDDKFNGYAENLLFKWIEEAELDYKKGVLSNHIKLATSKVAARRGMMKELKRGANKGINGMNTNRADLNGLIQAEEAVLQRLVIIEFKDECNTDEIDSISASILKNEASFNYSLFYYFTCIHKINKSYSPERYFGKEKNEYITKQQKKNPNMVMRWLIDEFENISNIGHVKDVEGYYIINNEGTRSYNKYIKDNGTIGCVSTKWRDELLNIGWNEKSHTTNDIYAKHFMFINKDVFDSWLASNTHDEDE